MDEENHTDFMNWLNMLLYYIISFIFLLCVIFNIILLTKNEENSKIRVLRMFPKKIIIQSLVWISLFYFPATSINIVTNMF